MGCFRVGSSYRATFDSGLRHVVLGLVPASPGSASGLPRIVALQMHNDGACPTVDPARVLEQVTLALRDHEAATGVPIRVDAVEYVPDDSPYYEKYYSLARNLALMIARGE